MKTLLKRNKSVTNRHRYNRTFSNTRTHIYSHDFVKKHQKQIIGENKQEYQEMDDN